MILQRGVSPEEMGKRNCTSGGLQLMYSMVVMMAMSSSPEAVACGKLFNKGCTGCYGTCTGVVYSGCTGVAYSGCTGCTGYSCHGGNKLFGGGCNGCKGGGLFSGGLFSK
jgi:hypothetical protein